MSKPEIKNLPVSVRDRLLHQARDNGRPFNEILQYYAIERFLYRLAQSQYANQFVLKGALLFRLWGLPDFRPTRDIDMLGYTSNDVDVLVSTIKEVCALEVQEDGVRFDPDSVVGTRIKEEADYEGVRVRFTGWLEKARLNLQVDVVFGDVVTPTPTVMDYPVFLPMPKPALRSYPPETMLAEKLQAMIYLGSINSRMKDFYDIWILARRFEFEGKSLQEAVRRTFEHRHTNIPRDVPAAFSAKFAQDKQSQWNAFLKTSLLTDVPDQIAVLLVFLQEFILPLFVSIRAGEKLKKGWTAGGPWK